MKGIDSLDLYVLENVFIKTIKTGPSAPATDPLTICQRVLFMNEELAVYVDVDQSFDFENTEDFFRCPGQQPGPGRSDFPDPASHRWHGHDPPVPKLLRAGLQCQSRGRDELAQPEDIFIGA